MLTAVIARPPVFGATLVSVDDSAARAVKGVTDVVQVPRGVAVLAEGFWAAKQGRDALQIEWDESTGETRSSADLMAEYRKLAETPGLVAREEGDAAAAIAGARSEEHTSELQSLMRISYAVFCLKKKNTSNKTCHTSVIYMM